MGHPSGTVGTKHRASGGMRAFFALTKKKTELENTMILSRIRALNLTPEELRIFLESGTLPDNNNSDVKLYN